MTMCKFIKAVLKYMDKRGMLEAVKKNNRSPSGQSSGKKPDWKPPQ